MGGLSPAPLRYCVPSALTPGLAYTLLRTTLGGGAKQAHHREFQTGLREASVNCSGPPGL